MNRAVNYQVASSPGDGPVTLPTAYEIQDFAEANRIFCITKKQLLAEYANDFGNFCYALPKAVFIPTSVEQLQQVVAFVHLKKMHIIARGAGSSQTGQSLSAAGGVLIDMRKLGNSIKIEQDEAGQTLAYCSTGVTLKQLIAVTLEQGYIPPVLPFYHELTVGGVLSAGGIGSASHKYGAFISNVYELQVLTADGTTHTCTRSHLPGLFHGVLGTFGQFGIILRAGLSLIKAADNYQTHRLCYKSIEEWLKDYSLLSRSPVSNLQGICIRQDKYEWNYLLEVTTTGEESLKNSSEITSLNYDAIVQTTDQTPAAFLNRYKDRFEKMRSEGKFEQHHPFLEFIVAEKNVKELIEYAANLLPPAYGDGFRLIYIDKKKLPKFFMVPAGERVCMFAILPTGIMGDDVEDSLLAAVKLHNFAIKLGCKRYLSGWLGMMDKHGMEQHYEGKIEDLVNCKKQLDPSGIFRSHFSEKYKQL